MAAADPSQRLRRRRIVLGLTFMTLSLAAVFSALILPRLLSTNSARNAAKIVVTSGDPIVRRHGPVTLSAYVETAAAETAILNTRSVSGLREQRPMVGDDKGAFHFTIPAAVEDLEYCVGYGSTSSDWHTITVIEAIDLAPGSRATVTPPTYASGLKPLIASLPGTVAGLQYSSATFDLLFDRPVADAFVEFLREGPNPFTERWPLTLAPDRRSGKLIQGLSRSGIVRISTIAEEKGRKLKTATDVPVYVTVDAPPSFESVAGLPWKGGEVRPGGKFTISVAAADDVGLETMAVEYETGQVPIVWKERQALRATGSAAFTLPASLRDGDTLRLRLRITDTRTLAEQRLGSQSTTFPATGWATFVVRESAAPIETQEVLAQQALLIAALASARESLQTSLTDILAVQTESATGEPLAGENVVRLQNSRERTLTTIQELLDAISKARLTVDLRPLAQSLEAVVQRRLVPSSASLQAAASEPGPTRRSLLAAVLGELRLAEAEIVSFSQQAARFSRHKLDRIALESIAADQHKFVELLRTAKFDRIAFEREQRFLLNRLNALVEESEPLKEAMARLAAADAGRLKHDIEAIQAGHHELREAIEATRAGLLATLREPLVRSTRDLADRLALSTRALEPACRLTGQPMPRAEELRGLADRLAQGQTLEVLIDQEKFAQSLDQLGRVFETWAVERRDPKFLARQLGLWQVDLQARLRDATRTVPLVELTPEVRGAFASEQAAIKRLAERIVLPLVEPLLATRAAAVSLLSRAESRITTSAADTDRVLTDAAENLARLGEQIPSVAERLAQSRNRFDLIRQEQDAIAVQADVILRSAGRIPPATVKKRLAEPLERQRRLVEVLPSLDVPGLETRRERILEIMLTAAEDLHLAWPHDIAASQAELKRELDRLRLAIEGTRPVDIAARDLAGKLSAFAQEADGLREEPSARTREKWRATLDTLLQESAALTAPESPTRAFELREELKRLESALRENLPAAEIAIRARAGSEAADRLADAVTGGELPIDRVRRFAAARRKESEMPVATPGKAVPSDAGLELQARSKRESDELTATRVGPSQPIKVRVIELYAKTRPGNTAPLAEALEELAAAMAESPPFTARKAPVVAKVADEADEFLPSQKLAGEVRDLSQDLRSLRERTTQIENEARLRLRPAPRDELHETIRGQRFLARDAGLAAGELANKRASGAQAAALAAVSARRAADLLRIGLLDEAEEEARTAIRHWQSVGDSQGEFEPRQNRILEQLAGVRDRTATATCQQKYRLEELMLRCDDVKAAFDDTTAAESGPFADSALQMKDAAAAMSVMLGELERGDVVSSEKGVARSAAAMKAASEALAAIAQDSVKDAEPLMRAAGFLRDVGKAMELSRTKLASESDEAKRAANEVIESIEKSQQALNELIRSTLAP